MAVSTSGLSAAIAFSLDQLGLSHVSLKEEQRSAIEAVYQGHDVFVCLPTGYGKRLCYQTLPFVMDFRSRARQEASNSAIIVVSPLIALMEDQVGGLRKRGVKACIISSSSALSKENICTEHSLGTDQLFFCAPEAIFTSKWRDAFERPDLCGRIVAVVVDEAHCVSQ